MTNNFSSYPNKLQLLGDKSQLMVAQMHKHTGEFFVRHPQSSHNYLQYPLTSA